MGFFKKKTNGLYAMANGKSIPIETVPDDVFASKMMGDGIAIIPSDGHIYAPCDGEVSMIMDHSLHALGIMNDVGMELLIHIGIDSVNLMGEGFVAHVNKHDKVKTGDLLISFDKDVLKEKGINDTTMLIIVEPKDHKIVSYKINEEVRVNESKIIEYI